MIRRGAALAASLAVLSIVACAYNTIPEWSRSPRYAGCAPDELRVVSRVFARAAHLSDTTLDAIDDRDNRDRAEADEWDAYRWWFGAFAPRRFASVKSVLAATRAEFERTISIRCGAMTVNCPGPQSAVSPRRRAEDPDEYGPEFEGDLPPRRKWKEFAYANHGIRMVQLCPDFFVQSRSDQVSILFHELTHISSDTEDFSYQEEDLLALAAEHPDRAARNAASYAAFAESVGFGRRPGGGDTKPVGDD
jgi:hypothetical protein